MAAPNDSVSMALFCDFENVALGVRDANYEKFDIKKVLERLLLKGSIVVKKAYCDWERYKGFKAAMHEANFELIEIPHVRQSGKNSADIRLVVDALDLCYTKSHVDTFVIISGDSDFSPLVSKLRENAKQVIGVGVKQSTSDLLIANCDEFIFYDDLVREQQRAARKESREAQPAPKRPPEEEARRKQELEQRRSKAIDLAVETFEALLAERGESGKIWASMLKEAIKRRNPGFNESYYGFRVFGNLLDEAQARGLLMVGRDEKSGAYVHRASADEGVAAPAVPAAVGHAASVPQAPAAAQPAAPRGRKAPGRSRRAHAERDHAPEEHAARPEPIAGGTGEAQLPAPAAPARPETAAVSGLPAGRGAAESAVTAPAVSEPAVAGGPVPAADSVAGEASRDDTPAEAGARRRGRAGQKVGARTAKARAQAEAPAVPASSAEVLPAPAAISASAMQAPAEASEVGEGPSGDKSPAGDKSPSGDKPSRKAGSRAGGRSGTGRGRSRKVSGTPEGSGEPQ